MDLDIHRPSRFGLLNVRSAAFVCHLHTVDMHHAWLAQQGPRLLAVLGPDGHAMMGWDGMGWYGGVGVGGGRACIVLWGMIGSCACSVRWPARLPGRARHTAALHRMACRSSRESLQPFLTEPRPLALRLAWPALDWTVAEQHASPAEAPPRHHQASSLVAS